jgi:hypothetical protein
MGGNIIQYSVPLAQQSMLCNRSNRLTPFAPAGKKRGADERQGEEPRQIATDTIVRIA